ncbi:hypothetical protein HZZ00_10890 [Streptomyces sp. NEAU-sy36]|uniref:hypothetical protein n=1 Tax=unclassified Streptomyces TaxID=2593676 RepID=UPI0015D5D6A4|nr:MULTISPECIES: hypothetical protein [unclassified Streptomyces]QLJ01476.1 hypothetical protein HZZ00_10890 [Streptomyces sp. NEAU-sy36]
MSDLTAFELLLRDNNLVGPSPFEVAFDQVESQIEVGTPVAVDVLDIARAAWDCLPDEAAREEALDTLFYGWWEARQARTEQAGGAL